MTIDKWVAFWFVAYLAGTGAVLALLPLEATGIWPLAVWTAFCVVLGLAVAEVRALSSAINNLPIERERQHRVPVKVGSAARRSHRR